MLGKVEQSPHLADKISKRLYPPASADMSDTEQMRTAVRDICMSEYHICGSVAMGAATNERLVIYGTKNIRCVDASIFPNHVSGNIVSSVYAAAEKAADLIKEDYLYGKLAQK
jgi:choline dehydrogenase-like flavoprotein